MFPAVFTVFIMLLLLLIIIVYYYHHHHHFIVYCAYKSDNKTNTKIEK